MAVLSAGPGAWREAALPEGCFAALDRPDEACLEADLEWLDQPAHHLIGWHSPDYPALLRTSSYPPAALFVAGDPDLLWHPQVAMVGSRRPTAGGRENARQFARAFGRAGFAVTSGLAEGIDTAAHLGAMETSRTIAVLGTGPDLMLPAGQRPLLRDIAATGAVVTEHPPGTPGKRQHFPSRNRLIAGLALGTVVIEAAVALRRADHRATGGRGGSGSVRAARLDPQPDGRGCHRLIRQGVGLAESPAEVIETLAPLAENLAGALARPPDRSRTSRLRQAGSATDARPAGAIDSGRPSATTR